MRAGAVTFTVFSVVVCFVGVMSLSVLSVFCYCVPQVFSLILWVVLKHAAKLVLRLDITKYSKHKIRHRVDI